MPDDRYLQMLDVKLNEELAEYQESISVEELADLLEVMRAVVKAGAGVGNSWSTRGRKKPLREAALRRRFF